MTTVPTAMMLSHVEIDICVAHAMTPTAAQKINGAGLRFTSMTLVTNAFVFILSPSFECARAI